MASELVSPRHTNRSFAAEALLDAFMSLTADQVVIASLLRAGVKPEALVAAAWTVKRASVGTKPVSIRQAATWLLMVVGDRQVRHEIARHVSVSRGVPLKDATRDLFALAIDCLRRVESAVIVVGGNG